MKHRVTKGESLYALARRYNVKTDQIQAANPQLTGGLPLGQIVLVPRGAARSSAATTAAKPSTTRDTGPAGSSAATPARHTVAKGETLFGIARRFNLAPTELIRINRLPAGGSVRVGQELLLTEAEAGASVAASTPDAAPAATETAPAAVTKPAEVAVKVLVKEEPIATVTPVTSPVERRELTPTRASEVISRVTESGMAATIEKSGTDKYLALHKTAPVGMIMQVKNTMNGQSVYVRVIGRLPDTGENNNVLVRLSPRAVQKLGTPDARFRVETSYVP